MWAITMRSRGNCSATGCSSTGLASSSDTFSQKVVPWWISTGTPSASAAAIRRTNRASDGWMFW